MKINRELESIGKYLSYLLRHDPSKEELHMDDYGYVSVSELLHKLDMSNDELDWIVENNNKKRFAYSADKSLIRANQGHSMDVDLNLSAIVPPDKLYHGTASNNFESIKKSGLIKGTRQHVHLTDDIKTAEKVGKRHVKGNEFPLMLVINTKEMYEDGYKIYLSVNNVYLTEHVPIKYIKVIP